MLRVYRGNRIEVLASLLAASLRLDPPDPFKAVEVVVNTWPTSRWLGERLAVDLGGIAANLRFPFPGSRLRALVDGLLDPTPAAATDAGADPWRAERLVWSVLPLLDGVARQEAGEPLRRWLQGRDAGRQLRLDTWSLARAIADAFDDYGLYRPELLRAWEEGRLQERGADPLPPSQHWQPLLYAALRERLPLEPFGLRVERAIAALASVAPDPGALPLRLFGVSSLAPVQVRLLQALSGPREVEVYLLSPCPDLWRRCASRRQRLSDGLALSQPLDGDWLLEARGLEARFGRLGAEFQQLLEGTGEDRIGDTRDTDLFLLHTPLATLAAAQDPPPARPQDHSPPGRPPGAAAGAPLLHQLQDQLAADRPASELRLLDGDHSLEFHACPGPLRQVQIVRDRILQLLHDDPSLEPRDILVMTPQVDRLAPLIAAVFGDSEATGVVLPWRLTDRSLQQEGGIARTLLALLQLAGERLTASGLETLLASAPLQERFGLDAAEAGRLTALLQRLGFRWGLDGRDRGGDPTHSLGWVIDRLLLGLVLPTTPGLAPGQEAPVAPADSGASLDLTGRWLHLLLRLRHWFGLLGRAARAADWAERLRELLADLFAEGGSAAAELPAVLAALDTWQELAGDSALLLEAPVVAVVLQEALAADSGRFGHRSGALTLSALEPMRAIPHRVIVLMGLDAGVFPRPSQRPGFHLLELRRRLGDPQPADQDRYVLLEALLSARSQLLITWSCRDDRRGEALQPATPVRQWLDWLETAFPGAGDALLVRHPASPLERTNFLPTPLRPPASCDLRLLAARRLLDAPQAPRQPFLLQRPMPERLGERGAAAGDDPFADLRAWLMQPQRQWLAALGLRPAEVERSLEDLEALSLGERERSSLLGALHDEAPPPAEAADWLERCRGQGRLPPRSAAALEARRLESRRRHLEALTAALGEPWEGEVAWQGWHCRQRWQGNAVLVVRLGRPDVPHHLDLWVQLLLACAAAPDPGRAPSRGVLIGRDSGDRYGTTTLSAPAPEDARAELLRLAGLREHWRLACSPVPPRSGWHWCKRERKDPGGGAEEVRRHWEGEPQRSAERQLPEMVACFGGDLPVEALLVPPFAALAEQLYSAPLAALVSASAPAGAGR
ncbi:MAG: exodeoxyribonuclease V subunit gamma [Cyanobium sp.]